MTPSELAPGLVPSHTDSGLYHKICLGHWANSKHDASRDGKSYLPTGACLPGTCSWNSAAMLREAQATWRGFVETTQDALVDGSSWAPSQDQLPSMSVHHLGHSSSAKPPDMEPGNITWSRRPTYQISVNPQHHERYQMVLLHHYISGCSVT